MHLTEFIVVRLNESGLPICFEPAVVGKVLITRIRNDFLLFPTMPVLHRMEKQNKCAKIYPVAKHANARYKSAVDCKLDIVAGLYLAVAHMVVFHVHERCIRVNLGITVSLFTADQFFLLALDPAVVQFFIPIPFPDDLRLLELVQHPFVVWLTGYIPGSSPRRRRRSGSGR